MKYQSEINVNLKEELLQLVSFRLANEEFCVDIDNVYEINRMTEITKIPNSPIFVEGVINLRGRVIPVISLRKRIGLDIKCDDKDTRIMVTEIDGKTIGFVVDSVNEVLRIPKSITENPPELVTGINSEYIKAIGKLDDRMLILINLEKIISTHEKEDIKHICAA